MISGFFSRRRFYPGFNKLLRSPYLSVILFISAAALTGFTLLRKEEPGLYAYSIESKKPQQIRLSGKLQEISGIAVSSSGQLFAHDDELSSLHQIDISSGRIIWSFSPGKSVFRGDFEDVAIVKDKFYLLESNGTIHQFYSPAKGGSQDHRVYKTGLSEKNDVEGLCYDPQSNSLLLACKAFAGKGYKGFRAVYSFSLSSLKLSAAPRFLIPFKEVQNRLNINKFHPSAISRNPLSGNFFIISASDNAILELSPAGNILAMQKLSGKSHPKPEGLAFLSDGTLLISDEDVQGGLISRYSLKK